MTPVFDSFVWRPRCSFGVTEQSSRPYHRQAAPIAEVSDRSRSRCRRQWPSCRTALLAIRVACPVSYQVHGDVTRTSIMTCQSSSQSIFVTPKRFEFGNCASCCVRNEPGRKPSPAERTSRFACFAISRKTCGEKLSRASEHTSPCRTSALTIPSCASQGVNIIRRTPG